MREGGREREGKEGSCQQSTEDGREGIKREELEETGGERGLPIYDDSLKFAANLIGINRLSFVLQHLAHELGQVVTTATDQLLRRQLHVTQESPTGGAGNRPALEPCRVLIREIKSPVSCKTTDRNVNRLLLEI